jgi:hypothetical protein
MLLSEISDKGVDTKEITTKLIRSSTIDYEVLKFINQYKIFDVLNFYDRLRVNYNNKKSKLYKSIVQIDEKEPKDVVVTLSSLLTQILLYSNNVEDKQLFLKHSRADEISKVLANYFVTYDLTLCIAILKLVKADLKALEGLETLNN